MPDTPDGADAGIEDLGTIAAEWTDSEFAGRIVSLLILDKGVVNAWQRTMETMIKVSRKREAILAKAAPAVARTAILDEAVQAVKTFAEDSGWCEDLVVEMLEGMKDA